ncbi:MAG: Kazal-type serine protease inhibitor, partial [Saprospiraceae bacterium]
MTKLKSFFGLFLVSLLFFTACKKDRITPETVENNSPENITTIDINAATQTRAMAAATFANSRNNSNPDSMDMDCGCYDLFDGVDFDASHEEVEAAVEAVLENLSEAEITRLFEPVCTDDGEIYESACIADCEGITNYHVCSEEELDDYFFGDFDCGTLDDLTFPTEIDLPDGTTITVNSEEELFEALENWFEEHGEDYEDEWEDEDFEDDFEDCFTLVYPIQIQFPGGETISYANEEDLYTSIEAWYDANPESKNDPLPIYPFEVLLEDGTTQTVSNEMEEEALWETCYGDIDFDICFELNFPITLVYPDSSTIDVNSEAELFTTIEAYYEANEDSAEDIDVQFPINITLTDGTVQTIDNEEALEAALEA